MAHTNLCPGNCGEKYDYGTCQADGTCSCNLGWTGPDCNEATCCPAYVIVLGSIVISVGIFIFVYLTYTRKKGTPAAKPKAGAKKTSTTASAVEAGTAGVASDPQSPQLPGAARKVSGTAQPRRSAQGAAPAPAPTAGAQRGSTISYNGVTSPTSPGIDKAARSSASSQGGLRNAAWGQQAPGDAGGGSPQVERTTGGRQPLNRSKTGESFRTNASEASQSTAGQASTSSESSLPNIPAVEADESPHIKVVNEKMRDMMDRPILQRKKTFKDLLVEHHPDKNPDEHAKEVFQAVNNARTWFLHERPEDSQNQDEPSKPE